MPKSLLIALSLLLSLTCEAQQNHGGLFDRASGLFDRDLTFKGGHGEDPAPTPSPTMTPKCDASQEKIEEIVTDFKSGLPNRYLAAFHEDAIVHMLSGHLKDGHQIRGKEQLGRALAVISSTGEVQEEETDEHGERKLVSDPSWKFTRFNDDKYTSVEGEDGNCIVYLSLDMMFSTDSTPDPVETLGIVRYLVTPDETPVVTAKLSVNDYCSPDTTVDANPDPNNRRRRLAETLPGDISSCGEAASAVEGYVNDMKEADLQYEAGDFVTLEEGGNCFVYYSGMSTSTGKDFLVRYKVDVDANELVEKLAIDSSENLCYVSVNVTQVP